MNNKQKIISFDFDCTLATPEMQELARELKAAGHKICITTTRQDKFHSKDESANEDLFAVADSLGITEIHFTNLKDKVEFFLGKPEFVLHIDDCKWEIEFIENEPLCRTRGFLWVNNPNWRQEFLELVEELCL